MTLKQHTLFTATSLLLISQLYSAAYAIDPAATLLPNAGLLMRETRELPKLTPRKEDLSIEVPEEKVRAPLKDDGMRVSVKNFVFSGDANLDKTTAAASGDNVESQPLKISNEDLQKIVAKYTSRPIGFNDLQAAAKEVQNYYQTKGYFLAHAYLPQQAIANGTVEIVIFEGRLDGSHLIESPSPINLIGKTRIHKSVIQKFLNAVPANQVQTLKDSNHLSMLINDLPLIDSKTVLAPGSRTGTSALSLDVKEGPLLTGYVSADNYGLYSTGYYRFEGGLNINDPFGWGDKLSLRTQTTDSGNLVAGWADYSLPINGYGTRLAFNFSQLNYQLGRVFTPLQAEGVVRIVGTSLVHPIYLNRDARLTALAHYEHRWLKDNINSVSPVYSNEREINVMSYSFFGSAYDGYLPMISGQQEFTGVTQAYINVAAGQVTFPDPVAYGRDQSTGLNTSGGYHKFNWQLSRSQFVWGGLEFYGNFTGQVASKNLDNSERISLGGPSAIRAYPVGQGSGSEGWIFNGETRYSIRNLPYVPGYLQLVGFIDTGYSRINANTIPSVANNSAHLTGYGFGINWLQAKGFSVRTSAAWRDVKTQPTSDPTAKGPQFYFQVLKEF